MVQYTRFVGAIGSAVGEAFILFLDKNSLFGIVYPLKTGLSIYIAVNRQKFIIKYINGYLLRRAKRWIKNGKDYMKKQ